MIDMYYFNLSNVWGVMRGVALKQSDSEKDLGVHVDSALKFREQAASAASKGNQVLALIRRSFENIDSVSLPRLYKTLVRRPQMQ